MTRFMTVIVFSILLLGVGSPEPGWAQDRVLLGERHVNDRTERDTIRVGKKHGTFSAVQVKATGAPVEFKRVVIHFENGAKQTFEKNRLLGKGKKSGRIDLEGGSRLIDKVVFHYEARTRGWKGADIKLWGLR